MKQKIRKYSRKKRLLNDEKDNFNGYDRLERFQWINIIDERMGFDKVESGPTLEGWLINMHETVLCDNIQGGKAAMMFYFLQDDGHTFKTILPFEPYFFIACKIGTDIEVEAYLRKKFQTITRIHRCMKEDLQMPNHLTGYRRLFLQLFFNNTSDLLNVQKVLLPMAEENRKKMDTLDILNEVSTATTDVMFHQEISHSSRFVLSEDYIIDAREYDVPYSVRVAIDKDIRVGKWYRVKAQTGTVTMDTIEDRISRAEPVVLAFDIETTKLPLKFPDSAIDQIMMISYMIDGQGFLITNRDIVSSDIDNFEYTPKPEYDGPFWIFNETDEKSMIQRFFNHIKDVKPTIIATYNGDIFDWPFIDARATMNGLNMYEEIGFTKDKNNEYQSSYCVHMDCYRWVKRDSYLPQGSQGLKAVTKVKLGYDPIELDPELMTRYAIEKPQVLAQYSVSDAVSTYYLYMKYVHPFIFSLCSIIPLNPGDVLSKGTGTLCEMLLMVQASKKGIILPNKHINHYDKHYEGHLLESETYVGGHVESLEAGVFRSDILEKFNIDPDIIEKLINELDPSLRFSIEIEAKKKVSDILNYNEIKQEIILQLEELKKKPHRTDYPRIYHLDVASMYPNIMITNRLQPDSMIDESKCASCDFNKPGKTCDKKMTWSWHGEFFPAKRDEYNMIKHALRNETFPAKIIGSSPKSFDELSVSEQSSIIQKRLTEYCKKIYGRFRDSKVVERETIVCQRENPFYVDTVKSFRDRRYELKDLQKQWKQRLDNIPSSDLLQIDEARKMVVLYDSLQLAHKVILNSFYGYVMRRGSRWYSMEMAGVTCLTGAKIIQTARQLIEKVGRPLELDTDGIWCILPAAFPQNYTFNFSNGKTLFISYPCVVLNHLIHSQFTNHQYHDLVDPTHYKYQIHSENCIFFEIDGPYKAMILPTSTEEDKNIKKKYAVFNNDGTFAELKGFEVKRRGELKLIKIFQSQVFKQFLEGTTLQECYDAVATIANKWLDILYSKGTTLADEELIDLISENRSMSKTLEEYGAQKSTSISTAKRLAEFLGNQMIKDRGLTCKFIISSKPSDASIVERAIPVAIFSTDENVKKYFLRKWLRDNSLSDYDIRTILDWDYYLKRLSSVIQKLIVIPAAMQMVSNPIHRVAQPEWLQKRQAAKLDKFKQHPITKTFQVLPKVTENIINTNKKSPLVSSDKSAEIIPKIITENKEITKEKENDPFAVLGPLTAKIDDDYKSWLQYQKRKWKIQKQSRDRRRHLFGSNIDINSNLSNFFRDKIMFIYTKTWEILEFHQTDIPGELRAWILIDDTLHKIRLIIPRIIYISFKSDDIPKLELKDCKIEKVSKFLPSGKHSNFLFELRISEQVYNNEQKSLLNFLNYPSIDGIFESQISIKERALLLLGAICEFKDTGQGSLKKAMEKGFDLTMLKKSDKNVLYLEKSKLNFIFLNFFSTGNRQIISLFFSNKPVANLFILDNSRETPVFPNFEKLYTELLSNCRSQDLFNDLAFQYSDSIAFKILILKNEKKLYKSLSNCLREYQTERHGPTIVVHTLKYDQLHQSFPILFDFPLMNFPQDDNNIPPLGWQTYLGKKAITSFLHLSAFISYRIKFSRYSNIPLCDMLEDDSKFVIDVTFARSLMEHNYLLWWSRSSVPDYGGSEKDWISHALEGLDIPLVNNPGSYENVCIEFDIKSLIISAVLNLAWINTSDSISDHMPDDFSVLDNDICNDSESFVDTNISGSVILVLKSLIKHWWSEATVGDTNADLMVQHFIRWVSSSDSFLYDTSLYIYIQKILKKVFINLLSDLKRAGSKIVFANAFRILIQTSKKNLDNACSYGLYIIKAIKNKPLYHFLDINIKEYWDYLLWMDDSNYGGKACLEVKEDLAINMVLHWHIANFLPEILQEEFKAWVAEFISLMYKSKLSTLEKYPVQHQFYTHTDKSQTLENPGENSIISEIAKPLIKRISQLIYQQNSFLKNPELAMNFEIPILPGSHLKINNPVLLFVKCICAVFDLVKEFSLDTRMLRRDLLKILDISEFSPESIFQNPSRSYILSVICQNCGFLQDVDFCRDNDLISLNQLGKKSFILKCVQCFSEYNKLAIEEMLIGKVQNMVTIYQIQDLRCKKCGKIKQSNLQEYCECSGANIPIIVLKEGTNDSQGKSQLLSNIAAILAIQSTISTTLGPLGADKLIVDEKGKIVVSNDGATIMKLLDIVHPAAKILVDIARSQDAEVGDGTTSVVILAGELLKEAKAYIEEGMSPLTISLGYRKAAQLAVDKIKEISVNIEKSDKEKFHEFLVKCAKTSMSSKLIHSYEDIFAKMVVDAVLTLDEELNEKLIGIKKVLGGAVQDSLLVQGVAFKKTFSYAGFEQQQKSYKNPKIVCLNVELELKAEKDNAEVRVEEVSEYQAIVDAEWRIIFEKLEALVNTGAKIVLSKLPIGDLATQYFADHDVFCAGRVSSDDLNRVVMAVGGSIQSTCFNIQPNHLGTCLSFEEKQIGGERFNIFEGCPLAKTCTIILRGSAEQFIAEVERSLHDAIMVVKRTIKNNSIVAGGGACEMEISKYLREYSRTITGKQQLIISSFAKALEVIPRQLCDNAGLDSTDILSNLRMHHAKGEKWAGVSIKSESVVDNFQEFIWEPSIVKINAILSATEAATMILSIDETIKNEPSQQPQVPSKVSQAIS
ncbi:hypothetical protein PCANB_002463 [Pneumocystis canis]|nr:hypothetical protein PCANB_002463 [Pneumocystis canis]